MKIRDIRSDQLVKIGTEKGSGYIYCGKCGDADLDALHTQIISELQKALDNALERERKAKDDYRIYQKSLKGQERKYEAARKMIDDITAMIGIDAKETKQAHAEAYKISEEIKKYQTLSERASGEAEKAHQAVMRNRKKIADVIPLKERNVVETYDSIDEDGVLCVIVEGIGEGKLWAINEDKKFNIGYLQGVIDVYGAALRMDTSTLEMDYETLYRQRNNAEKVQNNILSVLASEDHVEKAAFGLVKDASGLIRMCLMNAVKQLSHNSNGKQVHDPKEVELCIREMLGRN